MMKMKTNILRMKKVEVDKSISINYTGLFGNWINILHPLLTSNYFFNLYVFIIEAYKSFNTQEYTSVYPMYRSQVFSSFTHTAYKDVRVIIIGGEPTTKSKCNGIPFANLAGTSTVTDEAKAIMECVKSNVYNGKDFNFDYTMARWMNQGVLLLNSSLTSELNYKNSHSVVWKQFIRTTLNLISEQKKKDGEKIIFVFWGKDAAKFRNEIDLFNHYALFYRHPSETLEKGEEWNCPNFMQINKILKKTMGQSPIVW